MEKLKSKIILIVVFTLIILFFILKDDFSGIMDVLLNSNKIYILVALFVVLLSDIFRSIHMYLLIKFDHKEYTFKDALLLTIESNFFNGITPFSLGGQPFQMYVMKKKNNIDYTLSANILFKDFYVYQFALVTIGIVCIIINAIFKFIDLSANLILKKLLIIGLLVNIGVILFILYITYKKGDNHELIDILIKILHKLKIIKDKDLAIDESRKSLKKFKEHINDIKIQKKLIIKCYILNLLKLITLGTIGFICFKAIGINRVHIIDSVTLIILVMTMASFVPIPGASGGMEYGFIAFFTDYASTSELSAAMISWRFITYYFLVIIGGLIFMLEKRK